MKETREDLEGKCMEIWCQNFTETEKWNGIGCDCKMNHQGEFLCKLREEYPDPNT